MQAAGEQVRDFKKLLVGREDLELSYLYPSKPIPWKLSKKIIHIPMMIIYICRVVDSLQNAFTYISSIQQFSTQ